jgi:hypothetical protein
VQNIGLLTGANEPVEKVMGVDQHHVKKFHWGEMQLQ